MVSVSGGKDSTATYLLALERRERTGRNFRAVFADTGHEHDWTLDFVNTLASKTGGPEVQVVKADFTYYLANKREVIATKWRKDGVPEERVQRALELCVPTGIPFLDLCIGKGRFPSAKGRFCTGSLKIWPIQDQAYSPRWELGETIISWQGLRAEESPARRDLPVFARLESVENYTDYMDKPVRQGPAIRYLPILKWNLQDVWKMHYRHGIEPNPLYHRGANRVGCFPCIYGRKGELRMWAERFPEHVDRVREWEQIVSDASRRGDSTFFPHLNNPKMAGIDNIVVWSKTARGGKFKALLPIDDIRVEMGMSCSEWGVCE